MPRTITQPKKGPNKDDFLNINFAAYIYRRVVFIASEEKEDNAQVDTKEAIEKCLNGYQDSVRNELEEAINKVLEKNKEKYSEKLKEELAPIVNKYEIPGPLHYIAFCDLMITNPYAIHKFIIDNFNDGEDIDYDIRLHYTDLEVLFQKISETIDKNDHTLMPEGYDPEDPDEYWSKLREFQAVLGKVLEGGLINRSAFFYHYAIIR